MLLTARKLRKIFIIDKHKEFPLLMDIKTRMDNTKSGGCRNCLSDAIKRDLYKALNLDEELKAFFKNFYGVQQLYLAFRLSDGKKKELFVIQ